jgi:SAM-dependent methyltransferase
VTEPPLEDLLARLERERQKADAAYNEALTALDRTIHRAPVLPSAPAPFDASRIAEINRQWNILPDAPPPADRSLKGRLRSFVWRVVGPPLAAQKLFNASLVDHINRATVSSQELPRSIEAVIDALREQGEALGRFESLLVQYLQTITAYVDTKDRSGGGGGELRQRLALTEQRVLALKRALETMPAMATGATGADDVRPTAAPVPTRGAMARVFGASVDAPTYVGFEDRFRGSQSEIRRRVEDYLPILKAVSDIVDIGCGRGELLDGLKAAGVSARGVDVNQAMVDLCRSRGLDVEQGDALSYLDARADGSIGGLVAIQVVEHFEPAYLARFLETAFHKMRAGAPLILETINVACWMAFFETYIRDLTHQRPLHPDTLQYLVQASGFTSVDVQYRAPVGDGDRLAYASMAGDPTDALPAFATHLADTLNAHADKLNARLFSSMDYVVIARR